MTGRCLSARSSASALKLASMTLSWLTWSMVCSFFFLELDQEIPQRRIVKRFDGFLDHLGGGLLNLLAGGLVGVVVFLCLFDMAVAVEAVHQSSWFLSRGSCRLISFSISALSSSSNVLFMREAHCDRRDYFRFGIAEGDGLQKLVERYRFPLVHRAGIGLIAARRRRRHRR